MEILNKIFDFLFNVKREVWQDVVLAAIIIPTMLWLFERLKKWYLFTRPLYNLLKGYKKADSEILLYLSQISSADNSLQKLSNPKYMTRFPRPLPTNQNNLETQGYQNIDIVWSEADGRAATDVFNILGRIKKYKNLRIADTIKDWNKRNNPLFTIGFNPKTHDILDECSEIYYELDNGKLKIKGHEIQLNSQMPFDACIIQKTFLKNKNIPVFILAGLGTAGTEIAAHCLNQSAIELGKIYGNKSFCLLIKTDVTRGKDYYELKATYPRPNYLRSIFYPFTFYKWFKLKVFPTQNIWK